jgi:alpha-amylase/alpha-mannosidase (GH57 family)
VAPQISLALVLHNHQPVGNFDRVLAEVHDRAYRPMLEAIERHRGVRLSLHYTGPLLEWLRSERPDFVERLGALVSRGQVEMVGGGQFEPVLASIPERDRVGQLRRMADEIEALFGRRPRGAWLAERVWEPDLPTSLVAGGYAWTVLDDAHLRAAAVPEEAMWGAYTTEDQGNLVTIFGTEQGLRYRIPFGTVAEVIDHLRGHATAGGDHLGVMGDDGEKFGAWPSTWEHCWGRARWVDHFFDALEANADWLTTVTPSDWLDQRPPVGRIYVPTGSYAEMGEWALPPAESRSYAHALHEAVAEKRPETRWLRGGFWRNFQVRYREINDLHKRMLRTSDAVAAMMPGPGRDRAMDHLFRGQSNDCYWHGLFGGIYISHMRLATWEHLIAAEEIADAERGSLRAATQCDLDLDGRDEVLLADDGQVVTVDLDEGAGIGSWDIRSARHALTAVMRRREESYHETIRTADEREDESTDTGAVTSIHDQVGVTEPGLAAHLRYDAYERRSGLVRLLPPRRLADPSSEADDAVGDFLDRPYTVVALADGELVVRRDGVVDGPRGAQAVRVEKMIGLGRRAGGDPCGRVEPDDARRRRLALRLVRIGRRATPSRRKRGRRGGDAADPGQRPCRHRAGDHALPPGDGRLVADRDDLEVGDRVRAIVPGQLPGPALAGPTRAGRALVRADRSSRAGGPRPSRSHGVVTRGRLVVHGHFYQPLRIDPFSGEVPADPTAAPHRDWNTRISAECYRPNAERGNLGRMSWDLGPTLADWLRDGDPIAYRGFVDGDRPDDGGQQPAVVHGNAMAQPFHHAILPLASARDRRTEIRWGLRDFRSHFGRDAEGLWMPETAVDLATLRIAAEEGVRHTILAPWQASVPHVDTRRPYRVDLGDGLTMVVVFYDAGLSSAVSFEPDATADADRFARERVAPRAAVHDSGDDDLPLVVIATDGELYGHHQPFRELFLQRLIHPGPEVPDRGFDVVTLARALEEHADRPFRRMEIVDRTSWSCHHGVLRWSAECACVTDGRWKAPLRAALERLAGGVDTLTERIVRRMTGSPDAWSARDDYVGVVIGEEPASTFAARWLGKRRSDAEARGTLLALMEAQRWRLAMFASDGWYWDDPVRTETRHVLRAAARAARIVDGVTDARLERGLLEDLALLHSPSSRLSGARIYWDALDEVGQPVPET